MNETKLIFALNVTIDGFADHTEVIADEELHDFHTRLLDAVDTILFGRKTYELMESYWPNADKDPLSTRDMIDFANQINSMHKIVFSKTLTEVTWNNTDLVKTDMVEEVKRLKQQSGKVISIGGISAASELARQGLIDEFYLLVQPIILGKGKKRWAGINSRMNLRLVDSKTLASGVVVLHYTYVKT